MSFNIQPDYLKLEVGFRGLDDELPLGFQDCDFLIDGNILTIMWRQLATAVSLSKQLPASTTVYLSQQLPDLQTAYFQNDLLSLANYFQNDDIEAKLTVGDYQKVISKYNSPLFEQLCAQGSKLDGVDFG